jgi:hypothetical protein
MTVDCKYFKQKLSCQIFLYFEKPIIGVKGLGYMAVHTSNFHPLSNIACSGCCRCNNGRICRIRLH